ncbi:hypothetical protein K435DRAFT_771202 [Dendrothele bispora CBS 962.96]|uniref:Uncharacterized protein n=1 Tax=Dendrothele bispora (strain CBS 962.96) TaxID=1314807 RepID=A0A4S8KL27_DENBC|nr:hypothetical protein K435DRAFT_771202 [Dendrothele bispora CBS 962.96]
MVVMLESRLSMMTTTLTAPFLFSPTGLPRFPPSVSQRNMIRVSQQHRSLHRQLCYSSTRLDSFPLPFRLH